jgi:hypothetical protein
MIRRIVCCTVVMVAILGGGRPARAGDAATPPDFNGEWRLDAKHSDMPQRPGPGGSERGGEMGRGGWGGGGGGGGGRGGWGGGGRGGHEGRHGGGEGESGESKSSDGDPSSHNDTGRSGARPVRLPELMHVTETASIVSFEDSSGAVLREIATVPAEADTFTHAPGAEHVSGQWQDGKLVIQRTGPRESKITETISLKDDGKSLLIDTKVESGGDMPSREIKRVYNRVSQT